MQERSKVGHQSISSGFAAEDGTIKNPVQTAGVWRIELREKLRASTFSPRKGSFFRRRGTQIRDHSRMVMVQGIAVNDRGWRALASAKKSRARESPA
jgi:hypothetical protein